MIDSLKLHLPDWWVASEWVTFGRIRPVHLNIVGYGCCSFAGVGIALWLIPRLLKTPLRGARYAYAGALIWHVGVTLGVNSWLIVAFSTAFWMIPVVMDMVVEPTTLKWVRNFSLLIAGYMLRISMLWAHPFISLFFAWNILTMTLIQGILYLSLPLRVCNAYLLSDQEDTGKMLVMVSVTLSLVLIVAQYRTSRRSPAHRQMAALTAAFCRSQMPQNYKLFQLSGFTRHDIIQD